VEGELKITIKQGHSMKHRGRGIKNNYKERYWIEKLKTNV